jgi:hypothetical protein
VGKEMCTKYLYNFFERDHSVEQGRDKKNFFKSILKELVLKSKGGWKGLGLCPEAGFGSKFRLPLTEKWY